jgi:hypothetical protein
LSAAPQSEHEAPQYNWEFLGEGWRAHPSGYLTQESHAYRYWVASGTIDRAPGFEDQLGDGEASVRFHCEAHEQARRCRVDWVGEVRRIASARQAVICEDPLAMQLFGLHPRPNMVARFRCGCVRGACVVSWRSRWERLNHTKQLGAA